MSSKTTLGGPAYPSPSWPDGYEFKFEGMALRDAFAIAALQTMNYVALSPEAVASKAKLAYELADAMLAERMK